MLQCRINFLCCPSAVATPVVLAKLRRSNGNKNKPMLRHRPSRDRSRAKGTWVKLRSWAGAGDGVGVSGSTAYISGLWQNRRRFMAVSFSLSKACAIFEDCRRLRTEALLSSLRFEMKKGSSLVYFPALLLVGTCMAYATIRSPWKRLMAEERNFREYATRMRVTSESRG